MSVYRDMFEVAARNKFGSGFTYEEWYLPNRDAINYTITYGDETKDISISGLTLMQHEHKDIQSVMRNELDKAFGN